MIYLNIEILCTKKSHDLVQYNESSGNYDQFDLHAEWESASLNFFTLEIYGVNIENRIKKNWSI